MKTFHVVLVRSGPEWRPGRPLEDQSGWREHAAFHPGRGAVTLERCGLQGSRSGEILAST